MRLSSGCAWLLMPPELESTAGPVAAALAWLRRLARVGGPRAVKESERGGDAAMRRQRLDLRDLVTCCMQQSMVSVYTERLGPQADMLHRSSLMLCILCMCD